MVESNSMDPEVNKKVSKKRKKATKSPLETKNAKMMPDEELPTTQNIDSKTIGSQKMELPQVMFDGLSMDEIDARFPVLKNDELVQRFLAVSLTNNQKGRIRQALRDNLKGTSEHLLADVIHNRIQAILKTTQNLNDSDLRKIRILYNMLKTAVVNEKSLTEKKVLEKKNSNKEKKAKKAKKKKETREVKEVKEETEKEQLVKKEKGKKRYVVFLGNLPLDVSKEMIMEHFVELNQNIVDIRIPKLKEGKKSSIAYVELKNEPTYELALSKHHSMFGNKRIRVLYTTQKNGKITKAEAKSKAAKMVALQKSGKLIGSVPLNKKRSQRRLKMKKAIAQQQKDQGL